MKKTPVKVTAREFRDQASDDEGEAGYLYISTEKPWSDNLEEQLERVPDDWLEEHRGGLRVKYDRRKYLPQRLRLTTDGGSGSARAGMRLCGIPFPLLPQLSRRI